MVKTDCYHYFETTCSCKHFCNLYHKCDCEVCSSYIPREEAAENIQRYAAEELQKMRETECNK